MSRPRAGAEGDPVAPGEGREAETRDRIAAAAFELFAGQGYDGTTVDAIAERARIARRTFFRYFRSKDDVIFPDHDRLLDSVQRHLDASAGASPLEAVCGGVRLVLRSYVADPAVSVQRYRLARKVGALRQREIASVSRYERAFGHYLRDRLPATASPADAALRADVIAAAVVAAHNKVLRDWLRNDGVGDAVAALDGALAYVRRTFDPGPPGRPATEGDDHTVVAVFRAPMDFDDVVDEVRRHLADARPDARPDAS